MRRERRSACLCLQSPKDAGEGSRPRGARRDRAQPLARSLVATVHGHCVFALTGTFALLGEDDPRGAALARVRETLAAARD